MQLGSIYYRARADTRSTALFKESVIAILMTIRDLQTSRIFNLTASEIELKYFFTQL